MKPILAIVGGFALSFGMFIAGMLFALFVMVDEPPQAPSIANSNMSEVWSSEPRTVNTGVQNFERLPAAKKGAANGSQPAGGEQIGIGSAAAAVPEGGPAVDTMTTAAVPPGDETLPSERELPPEPSDDNQAAARLFTAHADWCSRRYRSYDAETNSYSPYAGGRRECMSPYWAEYAALTGASMPSDSNQRFAPPAEDEAFAQPAPSVEYAVDDAAVADDMGLVIDDQHVRDCFSRYRSYRPEDNTYQPWGGGPRQQCE